MEDSLNEIIRQRDEAQWYLGEERAKNQKLAEDLKSAIRQRDEAQWYLGEERARSRGVSGIPVSEVMATNPVAVDVEAPFSRVEELLRGHGIRHLPVVDVGNELCGIITQTDLYRTVSPMRNEDGELFYDKDVLDKYILKYIMKKDVFTLTAQHTLGEVVEIMLNKKYGCIPVVDGGRHLVGVVTQIDILKAIKKKEK